MPFLNRIVSCMKNGYPFKLLRYKATSPELEKRRAELMSRGLPKRKAIVGVKQILIVASGKGGVGKSTTAVNLAVALKHLEPHKKVGLLDADIFGPSIPLMMNLHDSPLLTHDNLMKPLDNYEIKCMSMGFLIDETSPVMWRGLMVMSAIDKLVRQVFWESIDYLIVDTPPGTGDTHLSLIQNVPLAGAVLVTTPQAAALQVARRGAIMFQKLGVPVAGIVQNMSSVICPQCQHSISIFGQGTQVLATDLRIPILQDIPLDPRITECSDSGKPVVIAHPDTPQATAYINLAEKVSVFLSKQPISSES